MSDETGATAIEYALIGTIVSIAIVTGVGAAGTSLLDMLTQVADAFG